MANNSNGNGIPMNQFIFEAGSNNTIINGGTFNGPVYTSPLKKHDSVEAAEEMAEAESGEIKAEQATESVSCIEDELLPIFYGSKEEVEHFMQAIKGAKGVQVVNQVCDLVKRKIISDVSCRKPLWSILNQHGYYTKSYSNWTKMVNSRG